MLGDRGNVVTSKRLTSDVEVNFLVFWVFGVETSQKSFKILCHIDLISPHFHQRICEAEARADWLVYKHHVRVVIPGVVIVNHLNLFICGASSRIVSVKVRSLFCERAKHTGTTWTSIEPNHERVL